MKSGSPQSQANWVMHIMVHFLTHYSAAIKAASALVTTIGGLIAAYIALYQLYLNRVLRRQELRFQQAKLAKEVFDEMIGFEPAIAAMDMLDGERLSYTNSSGEERPITKKKIIKALSAPDKDSSEDGRYIRNAFDYSYYYLDRIQHFIQTGLLRFEDIT